MKEYLVSSFQKIGFDLSDIQVNQFCNYYELLIEKNKVMNLTGITEFCQVVQKHFIDSIMSVSYTHLDVYKRQVWACTGWQAVWFKLLCSGLSTVTSTRLM